tara:strand:+ start:263 stop:658 length:396 start_codon:yes stop_codon:yes gene_type:complete
MIKINKNENNTIIATLAEKATLSKPFYLFVFTSDVDKTEVIFTAQDTTEFNERYNKFLITETSGTVDFTSGVISLTPTGFWSYKAYEQVDSSNLLVSNTTSLVEVGRVKVIGAEVFNTVYDNNKTYKGYGE